MTPYRVLDCQNYDKINNGILEYITTHTQLLTRDPRKDSTIQTQYCNFVDAKHFISNNPLLFAYFNELKLKLQDIYFTLAWEPTLGNRSRCPIHLDRPPVQWKMNWPVLNMENTAVRFFKLKDATQNINDFVTRTGIADSKDHDNYELPYEPFEETHRFRFNTKQPLIMNGLIPHDVHFYPDPQFPRIGMQAMFFKEPVHLL